MNDYIGMVVSKCDTPTAPLRTAQAYFYLLHATTPHTYAPPARTYLTPACLPPPHRLLLLPPTRTARPRIWMLATTRAPPRTRAFSPLIRRNAAAKGGGGGWRMGWHNTYRGDSWTF